MKFLVVLAVAVACASADVSHIVKSDEYNAPILKSTNDVNPDGSFQYAYETGNGIYSQAAGVVNNQNSEYPYLSVNGAYKYTAPDGTPVEVSYVADGEGFKPVGSHIPVSPPIPEAIIRSLEYIAAHPQPAEATAKAYKPLSG